MLSRIKDNFDASNANSIFMVGMKNLGHVLVLLFKKQFSVFKHHNTYFHNTFLLTHIEDDKI